MKFFAERIDKDVRRRAWRAFVKSSFERMTYTEAIAVLEKSGKTLRVPGQLGRWTCSPSTSAT